ncbi:MAG: CRTAC1 family protein [Pseudomonadales bacterium]
MSDTERDEARIRQAFQRSLIAIAAVILIGLLVLLGQRFNRTEPKPIELREALGPSSIKRDTLSTPDLVFTDITSSAGLDFTHVNGAYGERLLPETMGGGVAFLDFDNDGHQDIVLVNSNNWPWHATPGPSPRSRLYRNNGDGTFNDITLDAAFDVRLYGMGIAVGDYDGDGYVDVFISAYGSNKLMRNIRGTHFEDATADTGVAGANDAWSTSAAFFDFDHDLDLDLFVTNYVGWSREIDREVDYRLTGIGRAYGPPTDFSGTHNYLYRNDNGRFVDVTIEAGIAVTQEGSPLAVGKGLAVLPVDINGDGWLDLAVANDTVRNFLFVNQQDGGFLERGVDYGFAFDSAGLATGAMGIDAARNGDNGSLSLAIGNFANEMSSFYVLRENEDVFSDNAIVAGIGGDSRRALTFGLVFFDADLDGRLDLLATNGHVEPDINRVQASQQYRQPVQLFWNCPSKCSRPYQLARNTGDLGIARAGRGAAYADIDADGDLDIILTQVNGKASLLRNDVATDNHWVRLQLKSTPPNPNAIGATVTLLSPNGQQHRTVMPTRSYLSQVELPLTFGLGPTETIQQVTVRWPNGAIEEWNDLDVDRLHILRQGHIEP